MIREAIEGHLKSLETHSDPIPGPIDIEAQPSRREPAASELAAARGVEI